MSLISSVLDSLTEYIQVKGEKIKLQVMAKVATFLGTFVAFLLLLILAMFFVGLVSVAAGAYLNEVLRSNYLGYLIVSGVFLIKIIIMILLIRAKKIQKWLEVAFIKYTDNTDSDE